MVLVKELKSAGLTTPNQAVVCASNLPRALHVDTLEHMHAHMHIHPRLQMFNPRFTPLVRAHDRAFAPSLGGGGSIFARGVERGGERGEGENEGANARGVNGEHAWRMNKGYGVNNVHLRTWLLHSAFYRGISYLSAIHWFESVSFFALGGYRRKATGKCAQIASLAQASYRV